MIDLEKLTPKLKRGLLFRMEKLHGVSCVVIEDTASEGFWRVGVDEFELISRLDGRSTVADARQQANGSSSCQLSSEQTRSIVMQLLHEGLLENMQSQAREQPTTRWLRRLNSSVFFRLRLGNPQSILEWLFPLVGFLVSPWLFPAWLLTVIASATVAVVHWDQLSEGAVRVISPDSWIYFLLIWWGLKLVHELAHGLACVRYGGTVRETGILLLLFAPLGAYVDVTSSWRFPSKWKRIHVTIAGVYIELWIASLSILIWSWTSDPLVQQLCLQTFLLASVATLFFNGNPLIRFDGYYLLSDLLDLPNLYRRGQIAVQVAASRVFFGDRPLAMNSVPSEGLFVLLFGIACWTWRWILCLGIILAAATMFQGAGVALALALALGWVVMPLVRVGRGLLVRVRNRPVSLVRGALVVSIAGSAMFLLVTRWEVPRAVVAPGVVRSVDSTMVRAEVDGWVEELRVKPGQRVEAGDVLVRLRNPELNLEILRLQNEVRRQDLRLRKHAAAGEVALRQAEQEVRASVLEQLSARRDEVERLNVVAPHDGVIVDVDLDSLHGRHIERGDRLFDLCEPKDLEFRFSLPQSELAKLGAVGTGSESVLIFVPGPDPIAADPSALVLMPQARWDLQDPALAATNGGPVPVTDVLLANRKLETRSLVPRFHGHCPLPQEVRMTPGCVGQVRIELSRSTFASMAAPWFQQARDHVMARLLGRSFEG